MPDDEPTQETPQGLTIPVPTKDDVMRHLRQVAKDPRTDAKAGETTHEDS